MSNFERLMKAKRSILYNSVRNVRASEVNGKCFIETKLLPGAMTDYRSESGA
jgi:hypothetical protein